MPVDEVSFREGPEFSSFTSYQTVCKEEGSISVFIILAFLLAFFLFTYWKNRTTERAELEHPPEKPPPAIGAIYHPLKDPKWYKVYKIFIRPFAPSTQEDIVGVVFFFWFIMTIPMAITRYYEKRWAQEVTAEQGTLNVISSLMGCKSLNITVIAYTGPISDDPVPNPERGSGEELDPIFKLHLLGGILWLLFGFLQIFRARSGWSTNREIQLKIHRMFGMFVAIPALANHLFHTLKIVLRNPVNQQFPIMVTYYSVLFDSFLMCILGVRDMMNSKRIHPDPYPAIENSLKHGKPVPPEWKTALELRNRHKLRMAFCYFHSIFGSGPIRVTAWLLWLVGKFLNPYWQQRVDRGVCQSDAAIMGDATNCWIPVFVNLAWSQLLILWIEWLYVSVPGTEMSLESCPIDAKVFKKKIEGITLGSLVLLVVLLFEPLDDIVFWLIPPFSLYSRVNTWRWLIAEEVEKPPESPPSGGSHIKHFYKRKKFIVHSYLQNAYYGGDLYAHLEHPHED